MTPRLRPLAVCLAVAGCPAALAQTAVQQAPATPARTLETITVSASPLGLDAQSMATPADTLDGSELVLRREATLGSSLTSLPGVNADTFGAGASRPVIRGQSAPRVTVLSDGSGLMDASGVSPDHAVTTEPMLARRIEVLRGPATLLYGSDAIGGVVNVLDDKIPEAVPERGVEGSVEINGTTGSRERAGAFGLTAGQGNFAIHVEGMKRRSDAYRVPHWTSGKVEGSQTESAMGSVGMSWIGDRGFLGLAYTQTESEYGLPGHSHEYEGCHAHLGAHPHLHCEEHDHGDEGDDGDHEDEDHEDEDHEGHADHDHEHGVPYVKLKSKRVDLRGEYRQPFAGIQRVRLRGGFTDYRHHEIEEGEIATTFKNRGFDLRLEAEHEPIAGWRGVVGVQAARSDFSALGEEKFMPETRTRSTGLFLLEEYRLADWRFEVGARQEWQSTDPDEGHPSRSFNGTSVSGAAIWNFTPGYSAALSLSRSQRLPSAQELYAEGIHMATNTYELGNADLDKETSQNIDLTLRKHAGDARFSVSLFHNRVKNYIYANTLDRYEDFRLIEYAQADARFTGIEAQADYRFNSHFSAGVFGDLVRGKLTGGKGDLPRIPAARAGVRAKAMWNNWSGNVELYRVFRQSRVADYEDETGGYNMVNAGIAYDGRMGASDYTIYLRATNLFNQLAFNHASFISTAAPLPGRRVTLGLRVAY